MDTKCCLCYHSPGERLTVGGTNPYIKKQAVEKPTRKYKITFRYESKDRVVEVDPSRIPYGETGLPGSLLDIALGSGVEIDHACGGVCACSTCHVHVRAGLSSCPSASDAENDMLDLAPDLKPFSRLACQTVPDGNEDLIVEIPSWNRNLVREGL